MPCVLYNQCFVYVDSVAASKSQLTSMPVLDGLPQSVSQSSHNTGLAYQNSTTPNPPKDYTQPNLKTPVVSIIDLLLCVS